MNIQTHNLTSPLRFLHGAHRSLRRGITLIELLVAIAVMGIIGVLILPGVTGAREQAELQTARQQVLELQRAFDSWLIAEPSIASAQTAYGNAGLHANQVSFFSSALAPFMGADGAAEITANSNASQLQTEAMEKAGYTARLLWNYPSEHPKISFTSN